MTGARGPRRPASVARALSERARAQDAAPQDGVQLAGVFEGLQGLVEGLGKLAEAARQAGGAAGEPRVVVGYTLRTLDGAVQAFGHVPQPGTSPPDAPQAPAARTPIVDVFEEADAILVVAEVPGLDPARLTLAVEDGALLIAGEGAARYRHRVALPGAVDAAAMTHACRNGILEVRLPRAAGGGA